jgi:outer membrane protein assembly factor BamB
MLFKRRGNQFVLTTLALVLFLAQCRADDWPQWLGPQRDGIWRESGTLEHFPKTGVKFKWRAPIGGGYSGPAVADGKVFVTDWVLAAGGKNPANPFAKDRVAGKERLLCLDEKTGRTLWTFAYDSDYRISYPAGPRATPAVEGGKVYTLGAMGDLYCLEVQTGRVLWSKNFTRDYHAEVPLWGFAAHPLLDGNELICLVGGPESLVVAFHKDTGTELWRALSAREPGYCPPVIYDFSGKRQLIVWSPESINGLDPQTGKLYWSEPFQVKAALSIPTPRKMGENLFVTSFYNGSRMWHIGENPSSPELVWKGKSNNESPRLTDGLHSIMPTPFIVDGYIYGVCSYGELRCLNAQTGKRVWMTREPTGGQEVRWANAFLVKNGERFFLFNEKGDLIIANLRPEGYQEIGRVHLVDPTNSMPGRLVVWSHPAFADRCVFVRNDKEIVCASLAAEGSESSP